MGTFKDRLKKIEGIVFKDDSPLVKVFIAIESRNLDDPKKPDDKYKDNEGNIYTHEEIEKMNDINIMIGGVKPLVVDIIKHKDQANNLFTSEDVEAYKRTGRQMVILDEQDLLL